MTDLETTDREGAGSAPPVRSPADALAAHVTRAVTRLQEGYLRPDGPTSASVRGLARLRQAGGDPRELSPQSWALVLDDFPAELMGPQHGGLGEPSRAEIAAHTALTTYARHQQSLRSHRMHMVGVGLGKATQSAAQQRARPDAAAGLDETTIHSMHRVALAQSEALRAQALRSLVALLRSAERPVGVDYGRLARDLYWLQDTRVAPKVHLVWSRDLHARLKARDDQTTDAPDQSGDDT